uniref:NADH dehydrogenase subunit 4 n=1 Tax=Epiverta chelonia TaxID=1518448 RepID=UPI0020796A26|nr:NADH dehydrogenase subunit 4 [Epiverta chelonia]URN72940.1 NADH dehydrogenase subunit 4 [Epiverta chelonia]
MMKFILYLMFMMPLSFLGYFWLIQNLLSILSLMFFFLVSFTYFSSISFFLGLDLVSYLLILLSMWLGFLMFMASEKIFKLKDYHNFFIFMLLLLTLFLILTFSSMNLFVFYLFFEASLIPIMIIIMGWGYQPERIQAGVYLFFYTIMASLPLMLFIFFYFSNFFSLDYFFMKENFNSLIMYFMMNMVFFVKLPMFLVHLWLPKAHVEAPVSGSMILAGVMLKLGSYGLLRFMVMFKEIGLNFNFFLMNLSLMGGFLVSLLCIRQSDMKSLIAYSSVVHMSLMLSGLLTLSYWGISGSLIMMISHGLCSSGLFVLVNICYERFFSRNLYINKGLINLIPSLSLWWFLLVSSNMAAPPSLNLLGEIMLINSLISYSAFNLLFLILISFFSAVYSLYLYSFSQHGKFFSGLNSFAMVNLREFLVLFLHWIPLNLMFLKSDFFLL